MRFSRRLRGVLAFGCEPSGLVEMPAGDKDDRIGILETDFFRPPLALVGPDIDQTSRNRIYTNAFDVEGVIDGLILLKGFFIAVEKPYEVGSGNKEFIRARQGIKVMPHFFWKLDGNNTL